MSFNIHSHIKISDSKVWVNGELLDIKLSPDESFLKTLYKHLGLTYSKFYKMDSLSKLSFIASTLLLNNEEIKRKIEGFEEDKIGVFLQNSDSSVDVDRMFFESIIDQDNFHPSPALFVYTLPNISIGEISIFNKFRGENALFVNEKFDTGLQANYINHLVSKNKIDACISGWVNTNGLNQEALIYFALREDQENEIHNKQNLNKYYL